MRHIGADARETDRIRHRRDDRNGAIGRDGQHAGDRVPPRHLDHGRDVAKVDRLRRIGGAHARRLGVSVDRDHANAELLRPEDGAALMPAGADEEDGLALHAASTVAACVSPLRRMRTRVRSPCGT